MARRLSMCICLCNGIELKLESQQIAQVPMIMSKDNEQDKSPSNKPAPSLGAS